MDHDTLVWMAGLFDGEGSLCVQVQLPSRHRKTPIITPRMSIKLKYGWQVLHAFKDAFGGQLYAHGREGCDGWSWNLMGREALEIAVTQLRPHLRIKHDIADTFLRGVALIPSKKRRYTVNRHRGERAWTPAAEYQMMDIALTLNPASAKNAKQRQHAKKVRKYMTALKGVDHG